MSEPDLGLTGELGSRGLSGDLGQAGRELAVVMQHLVLTDQHRDLTGLRVLYPGHERACVRRSGSYGLRLGTTRGQARHDRSGAYRCSCQGGTLDKDTTRMLSHSWKTLRRQHDDCARRHTRSLARRASRSAHNARVAAPRTLCGLRPIAKGPRQTIMRQQLHASTWNRSSRRYECDCATCLSTQRREEGDFHVLVVV